MLFWVELCLRKIFFRFLAPVPVKVTLFGYRVFADVIKIRMVILDLGGP